MAGEILHLPALIGADLLARQATAGAGPLRFVEFVDMRGDWQVLEVGEIAPTLAPLYAPQLFRRICSASKVVCVDRLVIQVLGEAQQQLRQFTRGAQPIRARTVIPLLVTLQLQLYANQLDLQLLFLLALFIAIQQQLLHKHA